MYSATNIVFALFSKKEILILSSIIQMQGKHFHGYVKAFLDFIVDPGEGVSLYIYIYKTVYFLFYVFLPS